MLGLMKSVWVNYMLSFLYNLEQTLKIAIRCLLFRETLAAYQIYPICDCQQGPWYNFWSWNVPILPAKREQSELFLAPGMLI